MGKRAHSLFAFTTGIAVGTIIGILYAPDKGSNTRNKLTFKLGRYREKLKDLVEQLAEQDREHYNEAKSEGQKVVNEAKEKAERLLTDVEDMINQIKNKN